MDITKGKEIITLGSVRTANFNKGRVTLFLFSFLS